MWDLDKSAYKSILFHFPLLLHYISRQPSEGGSAGGKEKGNGESQGVVTSRGQPEIPENRNRGSCLVLWKMEDTELHLDRLQACPSGSLH